jgi:hypothetical protein
MQAGSMATNKNLFALFFLIFFLSSFAEAQTTGYIMERHLAQRLSWTGDDIAFRYEVVIEKEVDGVYGEHFRDFTNDTFMIVSLHHGKYRYRIIPYDFLDLPGESSQWAILEVLPLLAPEVEKISPSFIYLDDDTAHTLTVTGKNFAPDAEIALRTLGGAPIAPVTANIGADGASAWLIYNSDQLQSGEYEIVIKNPGGMETSKGVITFADRSDSQSTMSINISAAWAPLFPIYGESYSRNMIVLPGASVRFGIYSSEINVLHNTGFEITAGYYTFDEQHAMIIDFNLAAQKKFANKTMSLIFRFGAGYAMPIASEEHPPLWDTLNINTGFSFQWLVRKPLCLEIGIDYAHRFTTPHSGALKPWIGIGTQFY